MAIYNVMGDAEKVSAAIEQFKVGQRRIVIDVFPSQRPNERDVNVQIDAEQEDAFCDWCDEHGLKHELV